MGAAKNKGINFAGLVHFKILIEVLHTLDAT